MKSTPLHSSMRVTGETEATVAPLGCMLVAGGDTVEPEPAAAVPGPEIRDPAASGRTSPELAVPVRTLAQATALLMQDVTNQASPGAALYVVATPIGNTGDITLRALNILSLVDAVACEDTRNTAHLLTRFGLHKPLIAAHQHNEREVAEKLIVRLRAGQRIALVSDAGTPAVSDPGARIVDAVRNAGLQVIPLPGASAGIAALSASGLLDAQFYFAGFLPAKPAHRASMLASLRGLPAALIFYEAPHRIVQTVEALQAGFEATRPIVFARELTKFFEEIHRCRLADAGTWIGAGGHREKGEYVVILGGAPAATERDRIEADRVLAILMAQCPLKQAAGLAAQITGQKKNALYERALELKAANDGS